MSRLRKCKMRFVGLIASFGILFGCFFGSFCSATEKKVVGLKGGIEFQGSNGSKAENLSEREIVKVAIFMYGLAKNYVREFGFKDDNAKSFIKEFLKNSTEVLSKKGFKLEIKDMINSNITDEQLKKLETIKKNKDYSRLMLSKKDFVKVKKDVLELAKACRAEIKKDNRVIVATKKEGEDAVLEYIKGKINDKNKKLKKELSKADKNRSVAIRKEIKKLKKLLKGKEAALRKYADEELEEKLDLYESLIPSLDERVKQINEIEHEDIKDLNKSLNFVYSTNEK